MRLTDDEALARLRAHDHGILATVHPDRGVDAVPVAYALLSPDPVHAADDATHVGVPIDLVKPKASARLQRERNLEADPRATLLIEQWDRDDWAKLWWVRAELVWQSPAAVSDDLVTEARATALATSLEQRYRQYAGQPFARVLVFRIVGLAGWAASEAAPGEGDVGQPPRLGAVRSGAASTTDGSKNPSPPA